MENLFRQLRSKVSRKLGKDGRKNAKNAGFGTVEYVVGALTLFLTTPLVLTKLGDEILGILVLVHSVLSFGGGFSFGLGQATLKYVSKYRALDQPAEVHKVIRTTLGAYMVLGVVIGGALFLSAGFLAGSVFKVEDANVGTATLAFRIAAFGIVANFANMVFGSALKGFERFDVFSITNAARRVLVLIGQIAILFAGGGAPQLVLLLVLVMTAGVLVQWCFLSFRICPGLKLLPWIDFACLREVFSFGVHTWVASIFTMIRNNAGQLLVGAIVSAEAVAWYNIAMRLLGQVHTLLGRAFAFLFPYVSRLHEKGDTQSVRRAYDESTRTIILLSAALITPIFIGASPLVSLWLGEEAASKIVPVLQIMAARFAILPLGIVNYSFLLGTGNARAVMIVGGVSCFVVVTATAIGAVLGGLNGAAWGQTAIFITVVFNRMYLEKKLFGSFSLIRQLGALAAVTLPLIVASQFILRSGTPWLQVILVLMASSAVAAGIAFLVVYGSRRVQRLAAAPGAA